ncbi:hypothetical protein EJB05_51095, partial [Eragrostis curvula]
MCGIPLSRHFRCLATTTLLEQFIHHFCQKIHGVCKYLKQFPSPSALYFTACYFSRIGFQGDYPILFIRKNLLRSALELVNSKEFSLLNEQNVVIIPEVIFSLVLVF